MQISGINKDKQVAFPLIGIGLEAYSFFCFEASLNILIKKVFGQHNNSL